jgi:hypothetical protein
MTKEIVNKAVREVSDYKVSFSVNMKKGKEREVIKMNLCAVDEDTIRRYVHHTWDKQAPHILEITKRHS